MLYYTYAEKDLFTKQNEYADLQARVVKASGDSVNARQPVAAPAYELHALPERATSYHSTQFSTEEKSGHGFAIFIGVCLVIGVLVLLT